jgi:hypothetical protein
MRKEIFLKGKYNKLKMKKIGPCNILRKFVTNAYEIEFPEDIGIYPIFNVAYLYPYRIDDIEWKNDQDEIQWKENMPIVEKLQIENILDLRIAKKSREKVYYDYLFKWKYHPEEATSWITETDIHKHGKTVKELVDKIP